MTPPVLLHFTPTGLLVLNDEGTYRIYDISNGTHQQYSLGNEVNDLCIVSAKGYDDGFIVLTGGLQFLEVRGWKGGRGGAMAPSGEFPFFAIIALIDIWTMFVHEALP